MYCANTLLYPLKLNIDLVRHKNSIYTTFIIYKKNLKTKYVLIFTIRDP